MEQQQPITYDFHCMLNAQAFLLAVYMPRTLEGASIANLWKVLGWTGDGTKLLYLC